MHSTTRRHTVAVALLLAASLPPAPARGAESPDPPADPRPAAGPTTPTGPATTTAPAGTPPTPPPAAATASVRLEDVQAKLAEVEKIETLDEQLKKQLVELYTLARARLESATKDREAAERFKNALATLPEETRKLREALAATPSGATAPDPAQVRLPDVATSKEADRLLQSEQAKLTELRSERDRLSSELTALEGRPEVARGELATARKRLTEIDDQLKRPPPDGESPLLTAAGRTTLDARRLARDAEIARLEQELLANGALVEWTQASLERARRDTADQQARVKACESLSSRMLAAEAERDRKDAERERREALGKHSVVRYLTEANLLLTGETKALREETAALAPRRQEIEALRDRFVEDYKLAKERVDSAGVSDVLGRILVEQRRGLPKESDFRREVARRADSIADVGVSQYRVDEELRRLEALEQEVARTMEGVDATTTKLERQDIEREVRQLLEKRVELLGQRSEANADYMKKVGALDYAEKQLLLVAEEFSDFLDARLLWIPNAPPIGAETFGRVSTGIGWLVDTQRWSSVVDAVRARMREAAGSRILGLLLVAVLWSLRWWLVRRLAWISSLVARPTTDRVSLTLRALLLTVLIALPLPVTIWWIASALRPHDVPAEFPRQLATALTRIGAAAFAFEFLRQLCRPGGVAEAHLRWPAKALVPVRRHLPWTAVMVLGSLSIVAVTNHARDDSVSHGLGRIAFASGNIALAVFLALLLHPRTGAFADAIRKQPRRWLARTKSLWYPATVGSPVVLTVMAALGYFYTGVQLEIRLFVSLVLVLLLLLVHGVVVRWLLVAQRRIAIARHHEERRRQAEAATAREGETAPVDDSVEDERLDLVSLSEQSRQLIRAFLWLALLIGLWFTWAGVLPALGVLENVQLWETRVATGEGGQVVPISLADVLLGVVIIAFTLVAARNLPGVLEIGVLSNLPMSAGGRYAATTITSYVITAIGVVIAFQSIGVGWSQVQWLVAALSLGLGFGLQEIFGNFVSGLILLFERPIRVGDIVTVEGVTGTVSRIRIRATTITDWDRKEYVVPNREFVTGRLLNWTLSNTVNRIVINVGVAYGTDADRVREVLLDVARSHPLIMDDPAPMATFEGFGDSSLNFVLRCFLPDLSERLNVIHQLHDTIQERFASEGFEIPFPQRDLHWRSGGSPPLGGGEA